MSLYTEPLKVWQDEAIPRGVPEHLIQGLYDWASSEHCVYPGGFLCAVLEGDLFGAYGRADQLTLEGMQALVMFVYNQLPAGCWGSKDKMKAWHAERNAS
jgi:hypothetical protein